MATQEAPIIVTEEMVELKRVISNEVSKSLQLRSKRRCTFNAKNPRRAGNDISVEVFYGITPAEAEKDSVVLAIAATPSLFADEKGALYGAAHFVSALTVEVVGVTNTAYVRAGVVSQNAVLPKLCVAAMDRTVMQVLSKPDRDVLDDLYEDALNEKRTVFEQGKGTLTVKGILLAEGDNSGAKDAISSLEISNAIDALVLTGIPRGTSVTDKGNERIVVDVPSIAKGDAVMVLIKRATAGDQFPSVEVVLKATLSPSA